MEIRLSLYEAEVIFLYMLVEKAVRLGCSVEMKDRVGDKLIDAIESFSRIPGRAERGRK